MSVVQLNNTTFRPVTGGDVRAVITAGGKDPEKFAPNLNVGFSFGGGEEYFDNLNRTDKIITGKSEVKYDGEKVRLIEGSDIDEIYVDAQGRAKWDVIFERCPESMVLEWRRTCSPGLTAYHQPALTEEELREGAYRPPDVEGSYAIYCNKANNFIRPLNAKREIPSDWRAQIAAGAELGDVNIAAYRDYKNGKVGHKYRPFVVDADGRMEWCTLLIVGNVERVTLPKEFMQTAKYPVRLDPTIGYTSNGASYLDATASYACRGSLYGTQAAGAGASVVSLSIYGRGVGGDKTAYFGIYTIESSDLNTLAGSTSGTLSINSYTSKWWDIDADISLSNGSTYGVATGFNSAGTTRIHYDSGTDMAKRNSSIDLTSTWTSNATESRIYSLYATYTESGGGSGNNYYYMMNQ